MHIVEGIYDCLSVRRAKASPESERIRFRGNRAGI